MSHKITFEKTEFDYYSVYVDGKLKRDITIDKKPNGKFGCYDVKEGCYFGADDTTLKKCKEFIIDLYGFGI